MNSNKTYRIKVNEGEEYVDLNLNLEQDIDIFEILSLKINSENFYRLHTSKYGCVAGRVLANNAIGVPNVKLSIFIAADDETKEDAVLSYLYPYSSPSDKNSDGVKYNLLSEEQINACHQNVGSFPSKRLVLDDNNVFEVFDKYYKFTTTTNSAGDYMIFGVPKGTQMLHMDVDLSDIGDLLSQSPRDFIYKGYDVNQFESPSQFKKSTDLGSLPQIIYQEESVFVYPFWGDPSEMGETDSTGVRISRKDITLNYNFEPTCVFFGSIISDEKSNGFSEKCVPTERMGKMDRLTTGEGTIEMVRKTPDGDVESFNVSGTHLIDGDGTWCYQIPMNLDFVKTDENGNIVPTDNPNTGLPTRTRVRFRISLNDFASDYENNHLCKMLVPNNPHTLAELTNNAYAFGTLTPEHEFRDLLWNKVYSVKSYIPRIQKGNWNREKRFSGVKAVNVNSGNNPIPYNNMRIDITFMFILQCSIMHTLIWITSVFNQLVSWLINKDNPVRCCAFNMAQEIREGGKDKLKCLTVGDGACPDLDGWYFAPGCDGETQGSGADAVNLMVNTVKAIQDKMDGTDSAVTDTTSIESENKEPEQTCVTNNINYFIQCMEMALAEEYEVIQFDFYNDWLNGVLYIPRWFASIKKKRTYLWGLISANEAVRGCMETTFNVYRRYTQQCALSYDGASGVINENPGCADNPSEQKCHKSPGRKNIRIFSKKYTTPGGGVVHDEENVSDGKHVYYFRPCDFIKDRKTARVNYFLTDIILLGSLNEYDIDGIPQSFKGLMSSTYKMPTNIAATNMDTMGRMYGQQNGFICGGPSASQTTVSGLVSTVNSNFAAYENWASKSEWGQDSEDIESDPYEYPITEMAGINWGYVGPEQNYIPKNGYTYFNPGGHFLGLACFNSESTIVSCVNLSRVCEIGVTFSQRKEIPNKNGKYGDDRGILVVPPTGLISKDEISDSDFRSMFASLNSNGLATVKNENTGRYEYQFMPFDINNFDGALRQRTSGNTGGYINPYNNLNGVRLTDPGRTLYTRTLENESNGYRLFRFGLTKNAWTDGYEDKFLILNSLSVALPMYENSFYFYFGLHDGATALDKFYEKFYAECYQYTNFTPRAYIEIVKKTSSASENVCNGISGAITASTYGINEYTPWAIYAEDAEEGTPPIAEGIVEDSEIKCSEGLSAGTYVLSAGTLIASFEIVENDRVNMGIVTVAVTRLAVTLAGDATLPFGQVTRIEIVRKADEQVMKSYNISGSAYLKVSGGISSPGTYEVRYIYTCNGESRIFVYPKEFVI